MGSVYLVLAAICFGGVLYAFFTRKPIQFYLLILLTVLWIEQFIHFIPYPIGNVLITLTSTALIVVSLMVGDKNKCEPK